MLTSMRKLSKTWVFKGLMGLLVVSFGIWGIGDMFKGNQAQREVARVGGEKITVQTLQFEFQKLLPDIRKQYNSDMTAAQAMKFGVLDRALQMMIDRLAMDQETHAQGVVVSNDLILKNLANLPQFRDKDGKFNAPLFQQALNKAGLTEAAFFDLERREMARQIVLNMMREIPAPQTLVDNIYRARGEKRILEVVNISNEAMRGFKQPEMAEMKTYYEEHKDAFVAPEMRGFTIAALTVPTLEKDVVISDDELRKAYDQQAESLTAPETRDLVQIVVQEKEKADALAAKAKGSKDLSRAAKDSSLTAIVMKKVDDKTVLPELYTTVFGLEENAISPVVKSSLGYHVLQVKKVYPAGKPSFEAVKDEIREGLRQEKISERLAQTLKTWDDSIAAGTSLEDIADTLKLRLTRIAAADQFGRDLNAKKIDDIPLDGKLLEVAFAQAQGDVGQIIDDGKETYYVVRTDSVTPSQPRPFEDVKALVRERLTSLAAAAESAKLGAEIAESLRKGKTATSFAAQAGVEVRLSKPFSLLGERDKTLPSVAGQEAFKMKKGDVTDVAYDKGHLIVRLADIVQVNPARPESSRLKVVDDMKKAIPYDLIGLFSAYTKQEHPVKINVKLLEALKTQGEAER